MNVFGKNLKRIISIIYTNLMIMGVSAQGQIKRSELLNADIGKRTIGKVQIVQIEFSAGQHAPYHQHPCPVIGTITKGTCLIQVEGEPAKVLKAGDAFFEPANTPIVHFDNYSDLEPMTFVACYLVNEEKTLIELLPAKVENDR